MEHKISSLPFGYLTETIHDVITTRIPVGLQFTQRDVWDNLTDKEKDIILAGYPTANKARDAFFRAVSYNVEQYKYGLRGMTRIATHHAGRSVFVYVPPARPDRSLVGAGKNGHGIGTQVTFTLIGYTSDNKPLYRDDESGHVGWIQWESL